MYETIALVLGGGKGTRLYPLTKDRSKPAVPIGGKYRLIDIPISNCLNSNINCIYIVTQFNSASLNKHINQAYRFDNFHEGFIDILAAEQSNESSDWYQGTADAVRKNLKHLLSFPQLENVLILSGDQIYTMDYSRMMEFHKANKCDMTLAVIPVVEKDTAGFGIMKLDDYRVTDFIEKPKTPEARAGYANINLVKKYFPDIDPKKEYLASMGIYLFSREALVKLLDNDKTDFGKDLIPQAIRNMNVGGYLFDGYWEDVGTIDSFIKANIDFAADHASFDFYESKVYTNSRFLPGSRVCDSVVKQSLLTDGIIVGKGTTIERSVIGIRSIIGSNVTIEGSYVMGADWYEIPEHKDYNRKHQILDIGIGDNTVIKNAIIDKNARIGKNCKIVNEKNLQEFSGPNYNIVDGVIIVHKNATLPDGSVI
ncbi:MAG TPA: glucose-1-phosphate adenylyltransferase [Spirochaetota bacterium]|nr:glucose-1-phosphate adenylyltransferase [Spirochaetota bacterium]HPH03464.1 glucose-1-phosphate adenylyltransferase [Spirochaetota bacterium]HPN82738.1 glucose-1-phosphate adenylyltransferase [Spirochaetota bacterium]